ncbi:MAG: Maf family protein [Anaerolineales bacterium]
MRVVLASASPRRHELLAALLPEFEVSPAGIDEPLGSDAVAVACHLALEKALHVTRAHPGALVIGADTVVFDRDRPYGKPAGPSEARAMLEALQGRHHKVVTGVAVATNAGATSGASIATVTMRAMTSDDITRYIDTGVPFGKAGAYAIQHDAFPVVERLDGCYCSVMGLPLWSLKALIEAAGVACASPSSSFARCATCPDRPASA